MKKMLVANGCCFCDKVFTSFSYAAHHQLDSHSAQCRVNHMGYPYLIPEPVYIFVDRAPGRKGVIIKDGGVFQDGKRIGFYQTVGNTIHKTQSEKSGLNDPRTIIKKFKSVKSNTKWRIR